MTDSCYNFGVSCDPICDHGRHTFRERCDYCELQRQIIALTDTYKSLSIQIAAHHEHKLRQIDENRKISRRIDEIESKSISFSVLHSSNQSHDAWKAGCEMMMNNLQIKIDQLERLNQQCFDANPIKQIEERFKKLESEISKLCYKVNDLYQIREKMDFKKPYKCPVCSGQGGFYISGTMDSLCHSCKGKSIIWG